MAICFWRNHKSQFVYKIVLLGNLMTFLGLFRTITTAINHKVSGALLTLFIWTGFFRQMWTNLTENDCLTNACKPTWHCIAQIWAPTSEPTFDCWCYRTPQEFVWKFRNYLNQIEKAGNAYLRCILENTSKLVKEIKQAGSNLFNIVKQSASLVSNSQSGNSFELEKNPSISTISDICMHNVE